jgi:hypothetical protein
MFRKAWDALKGIEERQPIGAIGLAFSVFCFVLGWFANNLGFEKHPHLQFQTMTDTSVLDLGEVTGNIDILNNGESIKAQDKSLRVFTVRIANDSDVDITRGFYDEDAPLGLRIDTGIIAEKPQLIDASTPYLSERFKAEMKSPQFVAFSPMVLDRNSFLVVKMLILHDNDKRPNVVPVGKIAGIDHFTLNAEPDEPGFGDQVFTGGPLVQLVRLVCYGIGSVLVVVISVAIWGKVIIPAFEEYQRRRQLSGMPSGPAFQFLKRVYEKQGAWGLSQIARSVRSDRGAQLWQERLSNGEHVYGAPPMALSVKHIKRKPSWRVLLNVMANMELLEEKDGKLSLSQEFLEAWKAISERVEIHEEIEVDPERAYREGQAHREYLDNRIKELQRERRALRRQRSNTTKEAQKSLKGVGDSKPANDAAAGATRLNDGQESLPNDAG